MGDGALCVAGCSAARGAKCFRSTGQSTILMERIAWRVACGRCLAACLLQALILFCPTQRGPLASLEEPMLHRMDSALVGEHRGRIRTQCQRDQGAAYPT